MKNIDKISIVMPCYKSEDYIDLIIKDVINQTYSNWELIVVSNGAGQDAQLCIANSFANDDNRIKVCSIDTAGVSNARNFGMKRASGDWLTFVDSDDRIASNHLESLSQGVDDNVDIVIGGFTEHWVVEEQDYKILAPHIKGIDKSFIDMYDLLKKSLWSKLFKISMLRRWGGAMDTNLTLSEDAVFCYSLYCYTQKIATIPLSGYIYNSGNPGSALSKFHDCCEYAESLLLRYEKKMIDMIDADEEWKTEKFIRAKYMSSYFTICSLFKGEKILSYVSLKDRIKRITRNQDVINAVSYQRKYPSILNLRIYNYCVIHNNDFLLYTIFTLRKIWKKCIQKVHVRRKQ